jgi:hypothetical protein
VKRWFAILFGVMLLWTQFAPAQPVPSAVKCAKACCNAAHPLPCCTTPACESRPSAPVAPSQKAGSPERVLNLLSSAVSPALPGIAANQNAFPPSGSLLAVGAPLYERNCALLI